MMKHTLTPIITLLVLVLTGIQHLHAQNFGWTTSTTFDISNSAPLVLNSNVSNVGILNSGEGKTLTVVVNITHPYAGDISITLTSPAGTVINLTTNNGGSGDDYAVTVFSNTASNVISSGSAPFNGFFLPEESFSAFDGEFADGIWTMTISDDYSSDDGVFNGGQINFTDKNSFTYLLNDGSTSQQGSWANELQLPASGVTWGSNIHNQSNNALEFDGSNYATASKQAKPTNGVTMMAWIKPSNVNSDQKVMGIADASNVTDLVNIGVYNGTADFEVREENGSGRVSMGNLENDKWVHIAGTWSTSDNTMRLYVNGELVGITTGPGAPLSFTPPNTTSYFPAFGVAAWDLTSFKYEGSMDDMRMFGQALTEWQIKDFAANYNQFCETAVELPVEGNACNGNYYAHNYGGNGVNGPSPQCAGNFGGASWFSVTVPASGSLTISSTSVTGSSLSDNVIEVYSGTCGNLTYVDCEDDVNNSFAEVVLTGQTPGEVLYVKSWEYDNNSFGQYVICAFDQDLSVESSPMDDIAMLVYPNPANQFVTIEANLENAEDLSITLMNPLGQIVETIHLTNTQTIQHLMNVSNLPNGTYFVTITGKDVIQTERIVIGE